MKSAYRYEVKVEIELSQTEAFALYEHMLNHYDSSVRNLSAPGYDGVLHGARTHFFPEVLWYEEKSPCHILVTRRQLDTICKGLEMDGPATELAWPLMQLLRDMRNEQQRVCDEWEKNDGEVK